MMKKFSNIKPISIKEIKKYINNYIISINGVLSDIMISNIKPTNEANKFTLDWINSQKSQKQEIAEKTKAKVILCDISLKYTHKMAISGKILIHVHNPKLVVALIANRFFIEKPNPIIHPTASIHPEATISTSVYIGANCSIGKCTIEDGTYIHPNVIIYDNVKIGKNVIIQAGAVIGTDGLGCERTENGTLVKFPHFAGVKIENNVEIGANCQIARGVLSDTIIGEGSKINGLCFIAHNCVLGKNVWITGDSMIAGSVKIGDNVTIYSKVVIREQKSIGKGATIGMGAVVTKDVPDAETWIGNPAKIMHK